MRQTSGKMSKKILDIFATYASLLCNEEFITLKSNKERLEFILSYIKPLQGFCDQVFEKADNYCSEHRKDLQKSQNFRAHGQHWFQNSDYESAIDFFTKVSIYLFFK